MIFKIIVSIHNWVIIIFWSIVPNLKPEPWNIGFLATLSIYETRHEKTICKNKDADQTQTAPLFLLHE